MYQGAPRRRLPLRASIGTQPVFARFPAFSRAGFRPHRCRVTASTNAGLWVVGSVQERGSLDSPGEESGFELFVPLKISTFPRWQSRARKGAHSTSRELRANVRSVTSTRIFDNRLILWGVGLEIVLLLAINYTAFGNFILGTTPVPGRLWLFMVPFAVAVLESRKWFASDPAAHHPAGTAPHGVVPKLPGYVQPISKSWIE